MLDPAGDDGGGGPALELPAVVGAVAALGAEFLRSDGDYQLSPKFVGAWMKLLEGDPRFKEDEETLVLDM